jgi:acetolactate synthase-1/2/3 large subunit
MIKLSDYIVQRLADYGVRHVFMLTGGGAMHLNDSFGREERIQYICCHHEQACAIAAEGYARTLGQIAVVNVTSGPGGANTITGVLGQWLDSIPVLYISGQVRYDMTVASTGLALRQLGDQEANIVALVSPITKYAVMVTDPGTIRYHLERALFLATSGRPGPVWLDIPLNVQAAAIEPAQLLSYDRRQDETTFDPALTERQVALVLDRIRSAERPIILAGAGIRLAHAEQYLHRVIPRLGIPTQTAWDAIDLVPSDHPLYAGRPGALGQRAANFIFQNADCLLVLGCRLNPRQIGYNFSAVARQAYKIMVDIDPVELAKPTFHPDLPIHCDAALFLSSMERQLASAAIAPKTNWLAWCRERQRRYPAGIGSWFLVPGRESEPQEPRTKNQEPRTKNQDTKTPRTKNQEPGTGNEDVNPYVFCETLADTLADDDVIISANGAACVVPIQVLRIRPGQRHLVNSGCAAMGYGLPAAIGACLSLNRRRVICLEGDGSIQLNLQELQTVVHYQLPVKIFVFENAGYLSIRTMQRNYFDGRLVGEGPTSGVSFPDLMRVAEAYGIASSEIQRHSDIRPVTQSVLDAPGPALCIVHMSPEQTFVPRVASERLPDGTMRSKPLEDMYPFLPQAELLSNMLIPEWTPETDGRNHR